MQAIKQDGTSLRPVRDEEQRDPPVRAGESQTRDELEIQTRPLPFMAPLAPAGQLGTRQQIQEELDTIAYAVRSFHLKQPDLVMRECAAYGARLTELAVLLYRVEDLDRQYTRLRTQQVQRWLDELERQFRIASRLVEVARQDLSLLGGQP